MQKINWTRESRERMHATVKGRHFQGLANMGGLSGKRVRSWHVAELATPTGPTVCAVGLNLPRERVDAAVERYLERNPRAQA